MVMITYYYALLSNDVMSNFKKWSGKLKEGERGRGKIDVDIFSYFDVIDIEILFL